MSEGAEDEPQGTAPPLASSPFDPPQPPEQSPLATAGTIAGAAGVLMLDACTGGVLSALNAIPWGSSESPGPVDVRSLEQAMPGLAQTAPPRFTQNHQVLCTRCATPVPFGSMSLNDQGYFCAACAATMR